MSEKKTTAKSASKKTNTGYAREELASAGSFRHRIDLVNALLEEDKLYTKEEARKIIDGYLKGEVK